MHELVVQAPIRPGELSRAIRTYESVLSLLVQQGGFRGATMLVDRETGQGIFNTAWDTQAHMEAFQSTGALYAMLDVLAPVLAGRPRWKSYERPITLIG